ncbi:hypothetical protein VNI00_009926 [Paramarasmius palmivorus]|uniref:Lysosomal dipeptide transporter MFSD1 n=1 Tax=Paramarasmius palmivorus TaxID=297713 RepID=A0AAW0CKK7_9AGAR
MASPSLPTNISDSESAKSEGSVPAIIVPEQPAPAPIKDYPWRYKGPALACVLFFSLGSNWATTALSPLKSTLKEELNINNAQYGVVVSANHLVNTLVPIFSGMAIDYYGAEISSLVSSCFVMLGALIAAIGTNTSNFNTLIAGEVILGLGSITVLNSQSKLYTHWFYGSYVGMVYGIDLAWTRVVSVVAKATAIPITDGTGSYTWAFWVTCIMCGASLVVNAVYFVFAKRLPSDLQMVTGRQQGRGSVSSLRQLSWAPLKAIPASFWFITISRICQTGSIISFTNIAPDVIRVTRGISLATAGYIAAIENAIPIILTPLLGLFFDRFGRRMWFVSATAAVYIVVFVLINFTEVNPLAPIIISSVALSSNALPFLAAIPLLVRDRALIGTAFGIWKTFINAGNVIMDVSSGAIQDLTPTGRHTYNNVFYMYMTLKSLDVIYGLLYDRLDRWQLGGVLRMSEAQRIAKEQEDSPDLKKPLQRPLKLFTYLGMFLMGCMVVTAWALTIMPSFSRVKAANASYKPSEAPVAVFVGGTGGIGASMAEALSRYTNGNIHIIIAGRNKFAGRRTIETLLSSFPEDDYIREFVYCDCSLTKSVNAASEEITRLLKKLSKPRIDFLVFSANYASLADKKNDTEEGIDLQLMVRYYHRFQMTFLLLPLLDKSERASVMSILGAGSTYSVPEDGDYGFRKKEKGAGKLGIKMPTVYNDVGFQELAYRNPSISFTHIHPGFVRTSMLNAILADAYAKWYLLILYPLLRLFVFVFTKEPETAAEYMIYALLDAHEGFNRRNPAANDIGLMDHHAWGHKGDLLTRFHGIDILVLELSLE